RRASAASCRKWSSARSTPATCTCPMRSRRATRSSRSRYRRRTTWSRTTRSPWSRSRRTRPARTRSSSTCSRPTARRRCRSTASCRWSESGERGARRMVPGASPNAKGGAALAAGDAPPEGGNAARVRRRSWATRVTFVLLGVLATAFFLYLLVPLVALLAHAPPQKIWDEMGEPDVQQALVLSFVTTTISTVLAVIFGLPAAIVLSHGNFRGRRLLETLATIPTVLPPTVAGLALLLAYGRTGLVGKHLTAFGISIPFTT